MNANRLAKLSGNTISFDVPDKLSKCQTYAVNAMFRLYCAEIHIAQLHTQITALRDKLAAMQSDVADYQETINSLDAMLQQEQP
jgi:hypothetical protein